VLCPLCNAHFRVFLESAGTGTNRPFAEFSPPQPQSHTTPAFSTIPLAHPSSDPAFGPASAPLYTEPSSFFPPPYPPLPIVGPGDVPQTAALSSDMAESYQFSVVPPPDAPFGGTFNGGLAQTWRLTRRLDQRRIKLRSHPGRFLRSDLEREWRRSHSSAMLE
jgi:hypothetical protein